MAAKPRIVRSYCWTERFRYPIRLDQALIGSLAAPDGEPLLQCLLAEYNGLFGFAAKLADPDSRITDFKNAPSLVRAYAPEYFAPQYVGDDVPPNCLPGPQLLSWGSIDYRIAFAVLRLGMDVMLDLDDGYEYDQTGRLPLVEEGDPEKYYSIRAKLTGRLPEHRATLLQFLLMQHTLDIYQIIPVFRA